jgi:hypothetical protein
LTTDEGMVHKLIIFKVSETAIVVF